MNEATNEMTHYKNFVKHAEGTALIKEELVQDISVKVASIVVNGEWRWPNQYDMEVDQIMECMPDYCPNPDRLDTIRWTADPKGIFSTRSAYRIFQGVSANCKWSFIVWGLFHIPAHAFILWLAILGRLSTLDRMWRFVNIANFCILCKNAGESHDHLFFYCPFSSEVWNTLCHQAGITWPYLEWNRNIEWASCNWNGKNAMSLSFRLTLAAAVYFIWSERNQRTFGDANGRYPNHIANLIIDTVRRKLEISIKGDDWRTRNVIMHWSLSGDPGRSMRQDGVPQM